MSTGGASDGPTEPHTSRTAWGAADAEVAVRERLGHTAAGRPLTAAALAGTAVSTMEVADSHTQKIVNTTDPEAVRVVTREISGAAPYSLIRRWALHWRETAHTGIRYEPRFSTGPDPALAVFGKAGPNTQLTCARLATSDLHDLLGLKPVARVRRTIADIVE